MKKRIKLIAAVLLAVSCVMTACTLVPKVTVSDDGYLVVGGDKTEYRIAQMEQETSTGVETDSNDVIVVEDGYLVVNGVKTEYEVKIPHIHNFDKWNRYGEEGMACENCLYSRICEGCATVEWRQGTAEDHGWNSPVTTDPTCLSGGYDTRTCIYCGKSENMNETALSDHAYSDVYKNNDSVHWQECLLCEYATEEMEHELGRDGICTVCGAVVEATEGIVYDISADGTYAEVVAYKGSARRVRIAESYEGMPVTTILSRAFANADITTVFIPDGVTAIEDGAFSYCASLISVEIPDTVTTVGDRAFRSCESLTSIELPEGLTTIGEDAFRYCLSLPALVIPDSVTSIGNHAFRDCIALTFAEIPDSVTSAGAGLFLDCYALTSAVIGDGLTELGDNFFLNCRSLTSIVIGEGVTSIDGSILGGCVKLNLRQYGNCTYIGTQENPYQVLISVLDKRLRSYTIHEDTRSISEKAFSGCSSLTSVVIPDGVTYIGDSVFEYCESLTSVVIPDSVTSIGNFAFETCTSLDSVVIGNGVKSIESYAFENCYSLTSVVIPDSVTSIGYDAFWRCDLSEVYYVGTDVDWNEIEIEGGNSGLIYAPRYYYSATTPTISGNYWRYVDGAPTPW